jgi:hypothetical protein
MSKKPNITDTDENLESWTLEDKIKARENREASIAYYEQMHGFSSEELLRKAKEGSLPDTYEINHWLMLLEFRD